MDGPRDDLRTEASQRKTKATRHRYTWNLKYVTNGLPTTQKQTHCPEKRLAAATGEGAWGEARTGVWDWQMRGIAYGVYKQQGLLCGTGTVSVSCDS